MHKLNSAECLCSLQVDFEVRFSSAVSHLLTMVQNMTWGNESVVTKQHISHLHVVRLHVVLNVSVLHLLSSCQHETTVCNSYFIDLPSVKTTVEFADGFPKLAITAQDEITVHVRLYSYCGCSFVCCSSHQHSVFVFVVTFHVHVCGGDVASQQEYCRPPPAHKTYSYESDFKCTYRLRTEDAWHEEKERHVTWMYRWIDRYVLCSCGAT